MCQAIAWRWNEWAILISLAFGRKTFELYLGGMIQYKKGREEGRILTVRIFQEAKANPGATIEEIAEKVGCKEREVLDTLKMFNIN